jgi:hypothetical protein
MAIYQFHIRDERGLILDDEGVDLPDVLAVVREAIVSANEFFAEAETPSDMLFEITDEAGRIVLCVPIRNHAGARLGADSPIALAS